MKQMATDKSAIIPDIFLGTNTFKEYAALKTIVKTAIQNKLCAFDTAPSYHTEKMLGRAIFESLEETGGARKDVFISSKIDAWQMQEGNGDITKYVDLALKKLNLEYLDQLLIHWPIPEYLHKTWGSLTRLNLSGKVRVIGVCNVRRRHLEPLMYKGFGPMVVQNERHPLRIDAETLNFCKANNITYQAYSPVGQMIQPLRNAPVLKELATGYGKSIGQIIIKWHFQTGAVPVFSTTKIERMKEYLDIDDFSLSEEEVLEISGLDEDYKIYLESEGCPGF